MPGSLLPFLHEKWEVKKDGRVVKSFTDEARAKSFLAYLKTKAGGKIELTGGSKPSVRSHW